MNKYIIDFNCRINVDDIQQDAIDDNPEDVIANILSDAGYPDAYIDVMDVRKIR